MPSPLLRLRIAVIVLFFAFVRQIAAADGPVSFFFTTVQKEIVVDGRILRLDASAERVYGYGPPGQPSANNIPINEISAILLENQGVDAPGYDPRLDGLRPAPAEIDDLIKTRLPVSRQRSEEKQLKGTRSTLWAVNPASVLVIDLDLSGAFPAIGKGPATVTVLACLNQEQSYGDAKTRLDRLLQMVNSEIGHELTRRGFSIDDWNNALDRTPGKIAPIRVVTAYDWELGATRATELLTAHFDSLKKNEVADARIRSEITQAALDYYTGNKPKALATYKTLAERDENAVAYAMLAWDSETKDPTESDRLLETAWNAGNQWTQKRVATLRGIKSSVYAFGHASSMSGPPSHIPGMTPGQRSGPRAIDSITDIYPLEDLISHQLAYLNYITGIFEAKLADKATDDSQRKKLSASSANFFEQWGQTPDVLFEQDVFLRRALAIARVNGIRGQRRDIDSAHEHFLALEKLGLTDIKNRIALLHFNEELGDKSRPQSAAFKFKEAAVQGDTAAAYNLGLAYTFGIGVGTDFTEAARLLEIGRKDGFSAPVLDEFFKQQWPSSWKASNADGDEIEVTLARADQFPAYLNLYQPEAKSNAERVVAYRVRYRLVSAKGGRVFPDYNAPGIKPDIYSSSPVLSGEGEHIVWIGYKRPTRLIQHLNIYLMDAETRKALISVDVPIVATWSSYARGN